MYLINSAKFRSNSDDVFLVVSSFELSEAACMKIEYVSVVVW